MKKRWLCGTMALVIGAMAMAGCSGGNSSSSASAAGTEAADSGSSVDTSGAEMTIRVAHVCGTGSPYDYGANAFKKLVEEGSNGRIKVEVYAGDMTTDEVECVEMVQNNNLEITGLGFHEDGWRNILTKDKTINTVDDMKGVRMRTMQNEVCVATYEALGATPVALASGEQFTGLQNGVVDGTDNSALYAVADGYIEVVNNICDIHHYYSSGIIVASSKWYEGLSEEDQKLVKESAIKAGEEQRAWFLENDEAKIAEYEEKGYTVTRPTDIDAWKEKVAPVYDKMYAAHPTWEGLVEMVRAAK